MAAQHLWVEDVRFGSFTSAEHIAIDPFGVLYITDGSEHCMQTFDSTGKPRGKIGGYGWGMDQFDHPTGVDPRLGIIIYVADKGNHQVLRLDRALNVIGTFSTRNDPNQSEAFGYPLDVAVANSGRLYILDGENRRVVATTGGATIDNSFGGVESGPGQLQDPVAMALVPNDDLYVLERSRVVAFDTFGNFRFTFGSQMISEAKGIHAYRDLVFIVVSDALLVFKTDGSFVQKFSMPEFAFSEPVSEFRDVVIKGDRLYLLTAKTVITLNHH